MLALVVILCLVPLPLSLWTVLDPRSAWRIGTSWQYRDPKANEPSEAGYLLQRVAGGIGVVLTIFLIVMVVNMPK